MTDKELRALKRADLIEILYYLRSENDALRAENEKLKEKLDAVFDDTVRALQSLQNAGTVQPVQQQTPKSAKKTRSKKKRK